MRKVLMVICLLAILVGCVNEEYEKAMENGDNALENGEYDRAVDYYELALKEDPDDERAECSVTQSKRMISGTKAIDEGDFTKATGHFNAILDGDCGILVAASKVQLTNIEQIKTRNKKMKETFEKITTINENGQYEKAITMADRLLKYDMAATKIEYLEANLKDLKSDAENKLKKLSEKLDKTKNAYTQAQKLDDEGKYDEALELIENSLNQSLSHKKLQPLKRKLSELQNKVKANKEELLVKKEKQKLIDVVVGYWSRVNRALEMCHYTKTYYSCGAPASDYMEHGKITKWDVNVDEQKVFIQVKGAGIIKFQIMSNEKMISNNLFHVEKISREYAKEITEKDSTDFDMLLNYYEVNDE